MRVLPLLCVFGLALAGCGKRPPTVAPARVDAGDPAEMAVMARAEDQRRAKDVPETASRSPDFRVRRRAAQALARIADSDAERGLLHALEDEDLETVAWGAYGLGFACKGREEAHVRALSARAASLAVPDGGPAQPGARSGLDPRMAIARAVGRCGGPLAELVLTAWIRGGGVLAASAPFGLGDIARSRGLSDHAAAALLDAAAEAGDEERSLVLLYPFGREEHVGDAFAPRVVELATKAASDGKEDRSFAIRALARSGRPAADELGQIVQNDRFSASERAEAARGLSLLGQAGRAAASTALARLTPDRDPLAIAALGGDEYGVLLALLDSLAGEAPKEGLPALRALSTLAAPGQVPPTLTRRLSELRCSAASALANGAFDAEVLKTCDRTEDGLIGERAKLATLLRRPLVAERRALWQALAKSAHVRVREEALEGIAKHAELGEVVRPVLAEALASTLPGVVATAAELVQAHPDRVMTLSPKAIQSALDPSAPVSAAPAREIDRGVASALEIAMKRPWAEDLVETRVSLLDAAAAVRLPRAHADAETACHDPNVTVRDHALKDLRVLGDEREACPAPPPPAAASVDGGAPRPAVESAKPAKLVLSTDGGELKIVLDPTLTPVAVARFVELARRGFYDGIVVHRVVPGFVVQFGDPGGDGFGGSGALLRCETSPVPFEPLDVGVALSGRDTGSSQLFVTLGRYPHLDGDYAKVGTAQGDWAAVAEGDVIRTVKVED